VIRAYVLIQTRVGVAVQVAREVSKLDGVTSAEAVTGPYDVVAQAEAVDLDQLGEARGRRGFTVWAAFPGPSPVPWSHCKGPHASHPAGFLRGLGPCLRPVARGRPDGGPPPGRFHHLKNIQPAIRSVRPSFGALRKMPPSSVTRNWTAFAETADRIR
jgi:hypothetical protein